MITIEIVLFTLPERRIHRWQSKRAKEAVRRVEHALYRVVLFNHLFGDVNAWFVRVRNNNVNYVLPLLRPHIAE